MENGVTIIGGVKNKRIIKSGIGETLRGYGAGQTEAYHSVRGGGTAEGVNRVDINAVIQELSQAHHDEMLDRMSTRA